jgi:hypothetical protein
VPLSGVIRAVGALPAVRRQTSRHRQHFQLTVWSRMPASFNRNSKPASTGILVLSDVNPDGIRAALVLVKLDDDTEIRLSGTMLTVESGTSLRIAADTGDRCVGQRNLALVTALDSAPLAYDPANSMSMMSDASRVRSKTISPPSAETSKSPMSSPAPSAVSWRSSPLRRSTTQSSLCDRFP